MKKYFIVFGMIFIGMLPVNAAEQYNASTYSSDMSKNMQNFKQMYDLLTNTIQSKKFVNGSKYTKYYDVLNYNIYPANVKKIENGFLIPGNYENINGKLVIPYNYEVKFYKLKDVCSPVSSVVSSSTACGKVIIDVNGFNYGTNKYFSDKNTLQSKERGVLWMYSDAIKPAPNSIEDIILTITK